MAQQFLVAYELENPEPHHHERAAKVLEELGIETNLVKNSVFLAGGIVHVDAGKLAASVLAALHAAGLSPARVVVAEASVLTFGLVTIASIAHPQGDQCPDLGKARKIFRLLAARTYERRVRGYGTDLNACETVVVGPSIVAPAQ